MVTSINFTELTDAQLKDFLHAALKEAFKRQGKIVFEAYNEAEKVRQDFDLNQINHLLKKIL